jgi:hypothetical protein
VSILQLHALDASQPAAAHLSTTAALGMFSSCSTSTALPSWLGQTLHAVTHITVISADAQPAPPFPLNMLCSMTLQVHP